MKSMTGYGRASAEKEGRKIVIELKAVNHRFLDLGFKLPRAFAAFEDKIRKLISSRVFRGHVDVFLTYADNGLRPKRVDADLQLAKGILDCAELLRREFELVNDFQLNSLMKTPDVVTVSFDDDDPEILDALVTQAVSEALERLDEMRAAEGKKLASDMSLRLDEIESTLASIKERAPEVAAEYRKKLTDRIRDVLKNSVEVDEARLLNETAFFADKSNIDEEIERLSSHIAQARKIMAQDGECGKKLDFLIQEFNRESNTICSKSNDIRLTDFGLKLKNEIEKLREQVQNIE